MTPESRLKNEIRIYCGEHNWLCFHINVATIKLPNGSYLKTGVPKGWPDLTILTDTGVSIYCETKIHPRKPTEDQIKMIKNLKARGFRAFVAYSLEEFIYEIKK